VTTGAGARRSASDVDRIFKGVKAGDHPIEQPVGFELAFNIKRRRSSGWLFPSRSCCGRDSVRPRESGMPRCALVCRPRRSDRVGWEDSSKPVINRSSKA